MHGALFLLLCGHRSCMPRPMPNETAILHFPCGRLVTLGAAGSASLFLPVSMPMLGAPAMGRRWSAGDGPSCGACGRPPRGEGSVGSTLYGLLNPNTATPFVAPTYTCPRAIIGVMNLLPGPNVSRVPA